MFAKRLTPAVVGLCALVIPFSQPNAFCGFYVAKADTQLFNKASKVVLARDGDRTVITMVNDYRGDPREFAMVIPVPTVLPRDQIRVAEQRIIDHLDSYTAPRLVEYFDRNPCAPRVLDMASTGKPVQKVASAEARSEKSLGVKVEARYTVGEYDIVILSAEQSGGLKTWLSSNGYRLPDGLGPVLDDYIRAGMRFFVARVDLGERSRLGISFLRPLQIAFQSRHFMLPIRLGLANADGPQELFIFTLTRTGRVEVANYPTVRIPTDVDVPGFVKGSFGAFYSAMFDRQVRNKDMRAVFVEYAWDMAWCDPCAADPLPMADLRALGVSWPTGGGRLTGPKSAARNVFVTRLHLRYDADHFPSDLILKEAGDRENFQGRYVVRHAWRGPASQCLAAARYHAQRLVRQQREAQRLADITTWGLGDIQRKVDAASRK